jgi:hypothetical protein
MYGYGYLPGATGELESPEKEELWERTRISINQLFPSVTLTAISQPLPQIGNFHCAIC